MFPLCTWGLSVIVEWKAASLWKRPQARPACSRQSSLKEESANAALRIKGRQSFPHTVPQRFPFTTVCTNGSHFNLFFLNCSYAVPQIRVWKLYHLWASLYHEAEQLFCLSRLSNSFCSWETDKRLNPGCQSNVSRTGMCVKGISGIYFFFILLSWLWQDRKWADPHVGLFTSGRIKSGSCVLVPFAAASASVTLWWTLELSEWVPPFLQR